MRCVPVPGDLTESYIGAAGWTNEKIETKAIEALFKEEDKDTQLTVKAARMLGVRVVEMANILAQGVKECRAILANDPL